MPSERTGFDRVLAFRFAISSGTSGEGFALVGYARYYVLAALS